MSLKDKFMFKNAHDLSRFYTFSWLLIGSFFFCQFQVKASVASRSSKTLFLALKARPESFDPRFIEDEEGRLIETIIHCSLIKIDKNGNISPQLAKSWNWQDSTTFSVKLDRAFKFSDGGQVTANDVKATYDSLRESTNQRSKVRGPYFSSIVASVDSKKSDTVIFKLSKPDKNFLQKLAVGIISKMPEASCGAFFIKSTKESTILLERNPSFPSSKLSRAGKRSELIQNIQINFIPDEIQRYEKMKSGELDVIQNTSTQFLLSPERFEDLAKTVPFLRVLRRQGPSKTYLGFSVKRSDMNNTKVRQAISLGIDRDGIIKHVLKGFAQPIKSFSSPTSPNEFSYSPRKASALLDETPYKDPDGAGPLKRFQVNFAAPLEPTQILVAKAIATQLEAIGIESVVSVLTPPQFQEELSKNSLDMWLATATELPTSDVVSLWSEEALAIINTRIVGYELFLDGSLESLLEVSKN